MFIKRNEQNTTLGKSRINRAPPAPNGFIVGLWLVIDILRIETECNVCTDILLFKTERLQFSATPGSCLHLPAVLSSSIDVEVVDFIIPPQHGTEIPIILPFSMDAKLKEICFTVTLTSHVKL